jgi:hypothetical protein
MRYLIQSSAPFTFSLNICVVRTVLCKVPGRGGLRLSYIGDSQMRQGGVNIVTSGLLEVEGFGHLQSPLWQGAT